MLEDSLLVWLKSKKVVIFLGPGGVGKTTCSISFALQAAYAGKRVGLLSIDPAKRLAAALGMTLGMKPTSVPLHALDLVPGGSLEAAMIDQKKVFDSMVKKNAPSADVAEKILAHPIYQAASSHLAGPLEYMALAQLQDMISSQRYDLVVLDTPPDTHALEFLARPNVLEGFMENKVMTWLIKPFHMASKWGVGHLFSAGEKLMGGMAKVTGLHALRLVAEFLVLIQQVIEGFHQSSQLIQRSLRDAGTGFVLVTSPQSMAAAAALNLSRQLVPMGFHLDWVIINRCLPRSVKESLKGMKGSLPPLVQILDARYRSEQIICEQLIRECSKDHSIRVLEIGESPSPIDSESSLRELG